MRLAPLLFIVACGGTAQEIAIVDVPQRAVVMATPPPASAAEDPKPRADNPFAVGQEWDGTYFCAQGATNLTLRIERVDGYDVRAVFDFEHAQSGAAGTYVVSGHFDPSRNGMSFRPGAWREGPPSGYVSVGLNGTVAGTPPTSFNGTVDGPGCKWFRLNLMNDDIDYD